MDVIKPSLRPDENSLAGSLLLAMPGLNDSRFEKAVIYVCAHDDKGAMGLVVNHVMPDMTLDILFKQLAIETASAEEEKAIKDLPVMEGGPVEKGRGFILHSSEFQQKETVTLNDSFSVTGTMDAMRAVAQGQGPDKMLFMLGYAGWNPGQLDQEVQDNAWLVAEPDQDLVFAALPEEKWQKAVGKLGVDPAMLSCASGRA